VNLLGQWIGIRCKASADCYSLRGGARRSMNGSLAGYWRSLARSLSPGVAAAEILLASAPSRSPVSKTVHSALILLASTAPRRPSSTWNLIDAYGCLLLSAFCSPPLLSCLAECRWPPVLLDVAPFDSQQWRRCCWPACLRHPVVRPSSLSSSWRRARGLGSVNETWLLVAGVMRCQG
jgi:hypothetical protein